MLSAILLSLVQPGSAPTQESGSTVEYVILADESRRSRLQHLLADLARAGFRTAPGDSGLNYVACVSAWPTNPSEAASCIQSILELRDGKGTVVLHTYEPPPNAGDTVVTCIGSGGRHLLTLPAAPGRGEAPALQDCISQAARDGGRPPAGRYHVSVPDELKFADVSVARARAAGVLTIAVDHVGVPRGNRGTCLVQGRVTAVVRGAGLTPRGRIELGIPCIAGPDRGSSRRIEMRDLNEGSFANIYLSDSQELLDYEHLAR